MDKIINKFEIFIEEGLDKDNPYGEEEYCNCMVCDKPIKCSDTSFMVRQAVEVNLPHFGLPPIEADGTRTITKDTQIGPILGVTCSITCSEMYILQHI